MQDVPILDSVLTEYLAIFKINVVWYHDLKKYASIQELFKEHPYDALILYMEYENKNVEVTGHYTVLLKRTEEKYEFFESNQGAVPPLVQDLIKRSPRGTHVDFI
mgnify:CR=1 FL=1